MIGMSELIIIALAIIIMLRPDDWPKLVYTLGKWYQNWQTTYANVMNDIQEVKDIATEKHSILHGLDNREPFTQKSTLTESETKEELHKPDDTGIQ